MTTITAYGASDDLVEVEGDIREEFTYREPVQDGEANFLAFSDGTVLRIEYGDAGVWRITKAATGSGEVQIKQAAEDDEDSYSDRATLTGDVRWVVHGTRIERAK
jgi:hypothetical protein